MAISNHIHLFNLENIMENEEEKSRQQYVGWRSDVSQR